MNHRPLAKLIVSASVWIVPATAMAASPATAGQAGPETIAPTEACSAALAVGWPEPGTRIEQAHAVPATTGPHALPAHCEIFAIMHEHIGVDGQHYAIRFHMRLPDAWNGRFFFQGGGGSNGEIGDALGRVASGPNAMARPPALARGYAVVSQDSGHDNRLNSDPARGGPTAFGFDPQARADYGHASLAPVANAAKAIITGYYRRPIVRSYFVGCSKGGEEGMVLAQQHPDMFDGIVAAAPGFALPRAAVEEAFQVQTIAALARKPGAATVTLADFRESLPPATLALVADAVTEACDALDGAKDGIVGDIAACTTARVKPHLQSRICGPGKTAGCLTRSQEAAIETLMRGARGPNGHPLYSDWAWDPGLAAPGWAIWKLGTPDGKVPALNIVLGGSSLHTVFTVPPSAVPGDPQALLDAQLAFDVARDGQRIYATGGGFVRSAWQDVSARSPDLAAFAAHGGKLIVPHGVADPVFSINDTLAWWKSVNARAKGGAAAFVRVFPVPGMNHCGGGPGTDVFDAFSTLVEWVERGKAPVAIPGEAGTGSPWPGRTRPICAWPGHARYKGHGSIEDAANFDCAMPRGPR